MKMGLLCISRASTPSQQLMGDFSSGHTKGRKAGTLLVLE